MAEREPTQRPEDDDELSLQELNEAAGGGNDPVGLTLDGTNSNACEGGTCHNSGCS